MKNARSIMDVITPCTSHGRYRSAFDNTDKQLGSGVIATAQPRGA